MQYAYNVTVISDPNEPKGIHQALQGKDGKEWRESAKDEFETFLKRDSWDFVNRLEAVLAKKSIIGTK